MFQAAVITFIQRWSGIWMEILNVWWRKNIVVTFHGTIDCHCRESPQRDRYADSITMWHNLVMTQRHGTRSDLLPVRKNNSLNPGLVFSLLLGVSSDYAQPITGQVTEVTCPVIGRAQPELTPSKRRKTGPGDAFIHQYTETPLFQVMTSHLFRAKPLLSIDSVMMWTVSLVTRQKWKSILNTNILIPDNVI